MHDGYFPLGYLRVSSTDERSVECPRCRIAFRFCEGQKGDKQAVVHSFYAPLLLVGQTLLHAHLSAVVSIRVIPHKSTLDMTQSLGQGPVEHFP